MLTGGIPNLWLGQSRHHKNRTHLARPFPSPHGELGPPTRLPVNTTASPRSAAAGSLFTIAIQFSDTSTAKMFSSGTSY
jgi:hypothetical protein